MPFAVFSERILEDFETLDARMIGEYKPKTNILPCNPTLEKQEHETRSQHSTNSDDSSDNGPSSNYFLIFRQSALKYEVFRRPEV